MKSRKFYNFSVGFIIILLWQSFICGQTPDSTPSPQASASNDQTDIAKQISADDLVHFGDVIEIDVVGSYEYDWRGTLTPEGFLNTVDYLDTSFYGLCREVDKIAEDVEKEYAKILRAPKVIVRILDRSKRPNAYIYGAVKLQQRFSLKRHVKLNELIIISGGLTDEASGEIQIFRSPSASCSAMLKPKETVAPKNEESKERFVNASQDNGSQFINIKISDLLKGKDESNPQILSGDIITILEAKPIYVIGGVGDPKTISSRAEITLTRAIASAGNLSKDADGRQITIIRQEGLGTKIIEADLEKIKDGEADDIILKPYDIVDVPQRGKSNRKYSRIPDDVITKQDIAKLPLRIID